MNLPFLHRLPGLGKRPLHQVVASADAVATGAESALQYLLAELPELLMAAVITTGSGKVLASYATQPNLWPSTAAPFWTAAVQQLKASQAAQGPEPEQLKEILVTLPTQLHLLHLSPAGQHLLCLAIADADTNLALAREIMRQASTLINEVKL
jgi:predicted regulator of Ras-like GTPase activity (Roadblock/LC7/MglB family)